MPQTKTRPSTAPSIHPQPPLSLSANVNWASEIDAKLVMKEFKTSEKGLSTAEVLKRRKTYGWNEIESEKKKSRFVKLLAYFKDPLVLLLIGLALISYFTGDNKATGIIMTMIVLSISLRFIQETRADKAAEKLKALIRTTATVIRNGKTNEILLKELVPGDIVELSAGDMVPADVRLIESRDLFANQAALTGESLPVEKHAPAIVNKPCAVYDLSNICFMGTNIASGTATAVVVTTGRNTHFGDLAGSLAGREQTSTSFDQGIDKFTWLMIRFMLVMVPSVFLINGLSKGNWLEAFLFAVAVAVGLTPEMLPMIVTVNLSKAAIDMSRKKVIVKRLNSIQDFGAMDILCTDKTGTLTQGKVVLIKHIGVNGEDSPKVLQYAFLNSHFQTGLKNLLDHAVLKHDCAKTKLFAERFQKIDEMPFDFQRRRMSVVVSDKKGNQMLICKGAVEEVMNCVSHVETDGKITSLRNHHHELKNRLVDQLSSEGFRLIAVAYREMPDSKRHYSVADEHDLTLIGFLAFLDPPKETAARSLVQLKKYGVDVKILTGDNELVTRKICKEVGLEIQSILKGSEVAAMDDKALAKAAEQATVFDKLEPDQKRRIISVLRARGHVVGFMGDGINDAPALEAADIGISVDGAVDIAKESSDIILMEKSLMVLKDGVVEGRRAFANITKYIKMTASSNFGNMLSVVLGGLFLPFLPMLPLQVIINNLLYDLSQTSIPTDNVDDDHIQTPRQWKIAHLTKFVLFIGPMSSIFDIATYAVMLYVFNCWHNPALFHTGWFVESLATQTLIIHVIRTRKLPFFHSRASRPLTITTLLIVAFGAWLPYSPLAKELGYVPLPPLFWLILLGFLATYFILTQSMKNWFVKRYGWE
jgi:Mg2+-importing ATPase